MRRTAGKPSRSVREAHRAWLELVDTEGPFVALPVLVKAMPQGVPALSQGQRLAMTAVKPMFDKAWDDYDSSRDREAGLPAYREARDAWVEVVLQDVLGWGTFWVPDGAATSTTVWSPDHTVEVRPTGTLQRKDEIGALVWVIDPVSNLREAGGDGWAENPLDRMETMLRGANLPIGVVTDGRWWAIVSAADETLAASGVVDAQTWVEEPDVRDAFIELLRPGRLVGKDSNGRLAQLFADSVLAAEQVTEALGAQVRRAVELVVAALDESAAEVRHRGEPDPLPADGDEIYRAVVTILMRVVFLLFAEERGLLPTGELYAMGYGLSDQREALEQRERDEDAEGLDATALTWHRLLATSNALYNGATFDDLRLPAYGGSLFTPARFDFLTTTTERGTLAVTVSDRVMLEVLRAVQTATIDGELRRISFRDIDVEQIGYIYEGLLGYTCCRASEVLVGLSGKQGAEPEIPLSTLEDLYEEAGDDKSLGAALVAWIKENQPSAKGRTGGQYAKDAALGDSMTDAEQAVLSVTTDEDLRARLRGLIGLIRRDLRNRPVVVAEGGLVVTETPSRRNAGAHYTPRALAEEVVLHALEPIVYAPGPHQTPDHDTWRLKSSTELLDLKVADIACGSGAFLVAAARYLAARLLEAWYEEGIAQELDPAYRETAALRKVVARCLYGADINDMAVEMCKLSLWLVSLDRRLPFSFVDDKILHGNSMLGLTSTRQLEELHIAPKPQRMRQTAMEFSGNDLTVRMGVSDRIQRAISLRQSLASEVDDRDPMRSASTKRNQLRRLDEMTADLRKVADGVIAAGLTLGGKPGKKLDEAYEHLRIAAGRAIPEEDGVADTTTLDLIIERGLTPRVETDYERWKPLHWCLEVPDVIARGGFDTIIGNPPFLGGTKISTSNGDNVRNWMVFQVANGQTGQADIVAYFLLRALALLSSSGTLGLITTNTVAQGATRVVGLERATREGFTLTRSFQSRPWPSRSAQLEIGTIWGTRLNVPKGIIRVADNVPCREISSLLEPLGRVAGTPVRLQENEHISFAGVKIFGHGFVLDSEQRDLLIEADQRNSDVIFPYPHGKNDINGSPTLHASRWVINFGDRTEAESQNYPQAYERVKRLVAPVRQQASSSYSSRVKEHWWQYEAPRKGLLIALAGLEQTITCVQTSSTQAFVMVPAQQVFDQKLVVIASDRFSLLAVLSSSMHREWAIVWGSTRTADPVYTPSEVFEPFPRPRMSESLEREGRALQEVRRGIMLHRRLGLTKLYSLVNDPDVGDADVARMRQIHVEIDQAVMATYGWDDVSLNHGFHTYRQTTRWTVSPAARVEILDRLLEENHRRAALQEGAPMPSADEGDSDDTLEGDK